MKFLAKLFKKILNILQKEQCTAKIDLGDTTFFCIKNTGHAGRHITHRGREFF